MLKRKLVFIVLAAICVVTAAVLIPITVVNQEEKIETYDVTFESNGGSAIENQNIVSGKYANKPNNPTKEGNTFVGWYKDADLTIPFDFETEAITNDTTIYAKWMNQNGINLTKSSGYLESAYVEWKKVTGVNDYNVYIKKKDEPDSSYKAIDKPLIREYSDHYRADVVGLAAGEYTLKVTAAYSSEKEGGDITTNVQVTAYDRSGYAFDPNSTYKDASGAYNKDGTLKTGAQVIYVTAKTAKTVTATIGGATVTGFQSILDAKQKKGNKDILCIRIVGMIKKDDLDHISSKSEGLQIKGAENYQNMNLTIEGIGEDATVNGFGFLIRNCGNVEMRNLGIINFMDDGVSIDTNNCNLWIHNLDIFYGNAGGDSDQAKGDGSLDCKKSLYCTFSYNHFWDSGKCCLLDAGAGNGSDYITYHHNWFDHSDSRHPRVRNAGHVHVYNNYYDGNSKYGVGSTTGSCTFVEANYFRNCKYPMMISKQGTDALGDGTFSGEPGGMIKAFGNHIEGATSYLPYSKNPTQFDCYDANSRDELVPDSVKNTSGTGYNNFDTAKDFYSYTVDTAEEAKVKVEKYAGRMNGGDLKWVFNDAVEDTNYGIISELKSKVTNYQTTLVRVLGEESSTGGETGGENGGQTGGETPVTGTIYDFGDGKSIPTMSGVTIVGNASNSKGIVTYNGKEYKGCLKMESSTTITINVTTDCKVTLVYGGTTVAGGKKIKVDGKKTALDANGMITIDIKANTPCVITKGDSINLFLIIFN